MTSSATTLYVACVPWTESKNMYWEGFEHIKSRELHSGPISTNPEPQQPLFVTVNPERRKKHKWVIWKIYLWKVSTSLLLYHYISQSIQYIGQKDPQSEIRWNNLKDTQLSFWFTVFFWIVGHVKETVIVIEINNSSSFLRVELHQKLLDHLLKLVVIACCRIVLILNALVGESSSWHARNYAFLQRLEGQLYR